MSNEAEIQKQYYAQTSEDYNDLHVNEKGAHEFALAFLLATIDHFEFRSILDVGSGTGRVMLHLQQQRPDLIVRGIEPVAELREVAYRNGIARDHLTDGDATKIQHETGEFDIACEFGILHHIKQPELAVAEMLRVSNKAIFISDNNNFGQGSFAGRTFKQLINSVGLWKAFDLARTKGKGYMISEGDGLYYSYSVFNNYRQIKRSCKAIHLFNTEGGWANPYRTATHVALLGLKK